MTIYCLDIHYTDKTLNLFSVDVDRIEMTNIAVNEMSWQQCW